MGSAAQKMRQLILVTHEREMFDRRTIHFEMSNKGRIITLCMRPGHKGIQMDRYLNMNKC